MTLTRRIVLLPVAAVLATAGAAHAGKPPARTFSISPREQFVTVPVTIRGKHWPVGARCPRKVKLTFRESGRTHALGRAALKADGSFARTWRTPDGYGGKTVRIVAVESCGSAGTVRASATVRILPTP